MIEPDEEGYHAHAPLREKLAARHDGVMHKGRKDLLSLSFSHLCYFIHKAYTRLIQIVDFFARKRREIGVVPFLPCIMQVSVKFPLLDIDDASFDEMLIQ